MKNLFDAHRHKLSEGEKEVLWRRIVEPENPRLRRRARLWRRWEYSGAVLLAALLVAVLWRPGSMQDKQQLVPVPSETAPRAAGNRAPIEEKAPGTLAETDVEIVAPEIATEAGPDAGTSAPPAAPADGSPVAPSVPARREAAGETGRSGAAEGEMRITIQGEPPAESRPGGGSVSMEKHPATVDPIVVLGEKPLVDVGGAGAGKGLRVDAWRDVKALEAGGSWRDERGDRPPRRRPGCWTPPWYHNPNGEPFDAMYFEHHGTNPFVMTEEDALSTFALDVDNASYTLARAYLDRGALPPKDAVRVEEFVNYFDQGYEDCGDGGFCIHLDGAPSPFGEGYLLLRVGLQAKEVHGLERRPANLVFVVDTSGSMDREDRLGLVKRALRILLDELRESDTVGIVEYGSDARVVLEPTAVEDRRRIERALAGLRAGGSTNAEAGLWLGYDMASRMDSGDANTRIVLCSDGVANTGETRAEEILERVRLESDRGIGLSAVGFGMGNYNDVLMEKLADRGDGNYYYVDELDEAARVFRENLTGTLQTVVRDAKVQVEFDPESVLRWRLIGYENRDLADEDFRDETVDAGELGAGHSATALYEIKLSEEAESWLGRRSAGRVLLGEVYLRWEHPKHDPRAGEVEELGRPISLSQFADRFERADPHLRLDALAAEFAEILRGSYWARENGFEDLLALGRQMRQRFPGDESVRELNDMIEKAARIQRRDRD